MSEADEALARRAKDGDRAAFEELVRRTSRLVYARMYLDTGDPHRAEDLTQETFLQAFRSVRHLKDARSFRSWLLTISHRILIDSARRIQTQKRTRTATLPSTDSRSPEDEMQRDESRERVLSILRSLPEEYRLPLTLRYITGADYETIQMQLGLSNGSLRGALHRGLKMLRERMQDVEV